MRSWVLSAVLMAYCECPAVYSGMKAGAAAAAANVWLLLCPSLLCLTQTKSPSTFRGSSNSMDTLGTCGCLLDSAENCSAHWVSQPPLEPFIAITLVVSEGLHACLRVPACNSVTPFGPTWPSSQLTPGPISAWHRPTINSTVCARRPN